MPRKCNAKGKGSLGDHGFRIIHVIFFKFNCMFMCWFGSLSTKKIYEYYVQNKNQLNMHEKVEKYLCIIKINKYGQKLCNKCRQMYLYIT